MVLQNYSDFELNCFQLVLLFRKSLSFPLFKKMKYLLPLVGQLKLYQVKISSKSLLSNFLKMLIHINYCKQFD